MAHVPETATSGLLGVQNGLRTGKQSGDGEGKDFALRVAGAAERSLEHFTRCGGPGRRFPDPSSVQRRERRRYHPARRSTHIARATVVTSEREGGEGISDTQGVLWGACSRAKVSILSVA